MEVVRLDRSTAIGRKVEMIVGGDLLQFQPYWPEDANNFASSPYQPLTSVVVRGKPCSF